uniref:Putative calcineurin-like phosphoesterase n=1 Tax=viral metagenome TaxID=1070528 RepID=A0A6H1ZAA8_9ZZZZ
MQDENKTSKVDVSEFAQIIVDKIIDANPLIKVDYKGNPKGKFHEDAVLVISDCHIGKRNLYLNPETGQNEITYNTDIFLKTCGRLVNCVYTITDILQPSYAIDTLYVFFVGDILDNHFIYKGQQFFVDNDVGKQIWIAVKAFQEVLTAFLTKFKKVVVIGVPGNHGRMTPQIEEHFTTSTWDYQLLKILDVCFQNEKRIEFIVPESWYYVAKIRGWKYLLHHGNTVYSFFSLPYYGIVRQSKARRLELDYDIEIIGHFHQRLEIPTSSKTLTLVNGSWVPHDTFAWKKLGVQSKPEQHFFGVAEERPRTWSFEIDLSRDQ